ncbi:MAG: hypothetical protein RL025_1122, partial [Bacteroidota bacterium]
QKNKKTLTIEVLSHQHNRGASLYTSAVKIDQVSLGVGAGNSKKAASTGSKFMLLWGLIFRYGPPCERL